jgi:putative oxidoreductase
MENSSMLGALRATSPSLLPVVPRLIAGVPLTLIGFAHIFVPEAAMRPIIEALGLPFAALLAPLSVAAEIVAGLSILLGAWARVGALIAIPTMAVAFYSHLAIEEWPNPDNEPPFLLPVVILVAAAVVLWLGAGRWSLDERSSS